MLNSEKLLDMSIDLCAQVPSRGAQLSLHIQSIVEMMSSRLSFSENGNLSIMHEEIISLDIAAAKQESNRAVATVNFN